MRYNSVPHKNLRYKPQINPPAPAGIKIHVLAVSFALHSKEGMGDFSLINLQPSLYPLHTLLEAFPNVPVLSACGRANRREEKDNAQYFHVPESMGRLRSTFSYVTPKLKSLTVTLLHEGLYNDRFPDPGNYTWKMLTGRSKANRDF